MNSIRKYWPILLLLAAGIVWVCESTSATAASLRTKLQSIFGNAFTGLVELAAVVIIAIVVVVIILDLPAEILIVAVVAVAAILAYVGWKFFGWFKGLFGSGSSSTAPTGTTSAPTGTTTAPPYQLPTGPVIPAGNGWDVLNSGQLPGASYDPATGDITLPAGATWNNDNSVTINGLTYYTTGSSDQLQ